FELYSFSSNHGIPALFSNKVENIGSQHEIGSAQVCIGQLDAMINV
ncbi:MAG: hypothetical protein ACI9UN_005036, partial [Granulosicoccus sp.]